MGRAQRPVCQRRARLAAVGLLALLFANVALGLFYAILYSTTYIFGLDGAWIEHVAVWAVVIVETLAVRCCS